MSASSTVLDPKPQPRIRACIFDVDGLLINSEDLLTIAINTILSKYSHSPLSWTIKTQLQGRTLPQTARTVIDWAELPLTVDQFRAELFVLQQELFRTTQLLPGAEELLIQLAHAHTKTGPHENNHKAKSIATKIELAIATSSQQNLFHIKTDHLSNSFDLIPRKHRVMGDDPRLRPGRGKPMSDIYQLALLEINSEIHDSEGVTPEECLVFEDSVAGVEAGRRAGMSVIWVPHEGLRENFRGKEEQVLSGCIESVGDESRPSSMRAEMINSLEDFDYERYGIEVRL